MGHRKQYQVKIRQAKKRKKKRAKLAREEKNLSEYYYNRFYIKIK